MELKCLKQYTKETPPSVSRYTEHFRGSEEYLGYHRQLSSN